jgi:hypothetical protein
MANRLLKPTRGVPAAKRMVQTDVLPAQSVQPNLSRKIQPASPRKNRVREQPHPEYGVSQREVYDRMTTVEELVKKKQERATEKETLNAILADPAVEGPVKHHEKCEYILR